MYQQNYLIPKYELNNTDGVCKYMFLLNWTYISIRKFVTHVVGSDDSHQ